MRTDYLFKKGVKFRKCGTWDETSRIDAQASVASGSPDVGLRSDTRRLRQTLSEDEHPLFSKCYTA
jgi:hypothetical protein